MIDEKYEINPRAINTDCVEWHFGDGRQRVGGSTSKMTALQWDYADFHAGLSNAATMKMLGNNSSGQDRIDGSNDTNANSYFVRYKRH